MTKFRLAGLFGFLAVLIGLASSAQAQLSNQLYATPAPVSGADCSASKPCSLQNAIATSGDKSFISCINGGYSSNSIYVSSDYSFSNSFTIDCPGAVITKSGTSAFTFTGTNAQVVTLRNLTFDGGAIDAGGSAISPFLFVIGATTLIIENCKFQTLASNFQNGSAIAVQFNPNKPAGQLIIRDTVFSNNGVAPGTGGGLQVWPQSATGGSASVLLERVSFNYNVTAMVLNGAVTAVMKNSTVSASRSNGIIVSGGATLDIDDSALVFNVGAALGVFSGSTARLSNNTIKNNQTGVSNSGGSVLSYSNNRIVANNTNGTPLATIQGGQ